MATNFIAILSNKTLYVILPLLVLAMGLQVSVAQATSTSSNLPGPVAMKGKGKVSGKIVDASNQEPIPYATIALVEPASGKILDGTIADDNGKFMLDKIEEGEYTVQISFIGYETRNIPNIKISDSNDEVELGMVKLNPAVQELKEVTVEGQKDMFEEKVDRTVYNAENDATNRGGDATDVLRKVPSLSVDLDGNVSLRGSQNIKVLINNRPSTITAGSVADALKQIPADQIKSVEVITSPSARYDAEGTSGIINIITKKNTLEGASLNIDAGVGLRGSNLGLNGSYRKGKMGFSLGGFGRYGYNIHGNFENRQQTFDINRNPLSLTTQQAETQNRFLFGRYTLGWDYDINKNNFINASVQYGARNRNTFQDNLFTQTIRDNAVNTSLRDVTVSDLSGTVDINLNYTHTFNKPQKEFSILTQYSRNNQTNNFINSILTEDGLGISNRLKNLNQSFNQETTVQFDYQTPLGKNQLLELGGKEIMRQVTSNFTFYEAEGNDGEYVPSQADRLNNVFHYDQNVIAGYSSYTLNFKKTYGLKAGARYEYTSINARFRNEQDEIQIPSYGVLVPSLNLSKKFKKGNMIKVAYNRRIQRPSLQFLNPNRQAANPLDITIGNPYLSPEFTNNYELAYSTYLKGISLTLTTFLRNTNNSIQSIRDTLGEGVIQTTFQNIGKEDVYGFSVFSNINIANKLSLNGGTEIYYAMLDNNNPNPLYKASNEGWVYNIRGFGSYNFTKGWGLQLFGFYRGRQVQLQGLQAGFGIYSLSLKKDFNNKRGSIGIGAENFFTPSIKMRNELNTVFLTQTSTNIMFNRSVRLNFSYRLGKITSDNTPRRRRKSVNNDDLKEGGGDTGATGSAPMQAPAGGQGPRPAGGGQAPAQGGRPAGREQYQKTDSTQTVPSPQSDSIGTAPQGRVLPEVTPELETQGHQNPESVPAQVRGQDNSRQGQEKGQNTMPAQTPLSGISPAPVDNKKTNK